MYFFNDTATTEIYTLSLHDALPISVWRKSGEYPGRFQHPDRRRLCGAEWRFPAGEDHLQLGGKRRGETARTYRAPDRKSTRLNSSHANISYAVFCLKKQKESVAHRV